MNGRRVPRAHDAAVRRSPQGLRHGGRTSTYNVAMDQQLLIELAVAVVPAVALAWLSFLYGRRWEARHPHDEARGVHHA